VCLWVCVVLDLLPATVTFPAPAPALAPALALASSRKRGRGHEDAGGDAGGVLREQVIGFASDIRRGSVAALVQLRQFLLQNPAAKVVVCDTTCLDAVLEIVTREVPRVARWAPWGARARVQTQARVQTPALEALEAACRVLCTMYVICNGLSVAR
jgi:hypothetical protein